MGDSILTPRDQKALLALLDAKISGTPHAQRHPWESVRQRLAGDLSARPKSMASALATLVSSARAGQLDEVDRVARSLSASLLDHGDIDGSKLLARVADTKYERPAPPAAPAARGQGKGKGGGGGWINLRDLAAKHDDAEGAIRWHEPRDMGAEYVKDAHVGPVVERLVAELRLASTFLNAGIDAPTKILFTGPPGTGKTMTAQYVGSCLGLPVAVAKITKVVSKWCGETGPKLTAVIEAGAARGGVIFLDEIDGLCQSRADDGSSGASREMQRVTTGLLQDLDGLSPAQIVIAATNVPDNLDPALRSRLTFEVAFRNPDPDARRLMVTKDWAKVGHAPEAMVAFVAGTEGKSGRFLRSAAMCAARAAMLEASTLGNALASLEGKIDLAAVTSARITAEHVRVALEAVRKSGEA